MTHEFVAASKQSDLKKIPKNDHPQITQIFFRKRNDSSVLTKKSA